MGKFKVGDKVRILDGSKIKNYAGGWYRFMKEYVDTITTISSIYELSNGEIAYKCHGTAGYMFDERGLERCVNETIVIYRKDNETIALDKATGKKAIAKCSPEDTFDFNIGAKLAFDRLMHGNKENITVEDMRKMLKSYCDGMSCFDCKLKHQTCRCGLGTHFMFKDKTGNYTMSDKEIKSAFDIVFGNDVKEVKRRAKKGEYVKIVDAIASYGNYKNGDILRIVDDVDHVRYGYGNGQYLHDSEYVVLEGYKPEKEGKPEEPPKLYNGKIIFTKGDGMFKTGHICEVKDGRIVTTTYGSLPSSEPLRDIEDVKDYFTGNLDGNRKRKTGWSLYTLELMEVVKD